MRNKNQWVMKYIEDASFHGLKVCVDGKEYTYSDIRRRRNIIKENVDYMSDYVYDEQGKVVGIHFDKIK